MEEPKDEKNSLFNSLKRLETTILRCADLEVKSKALLTLFVGEIIDEEKIRASEKKSQSPTLIYSIDSINERLIYHLDRVNKILQLLGI